MPPNTIRISKIPADSMFPERYHAEWLNQDDILHRNKGRGPTERGARADLAAAMARDVCVRGAGDLRAELGELAEDAEVIAEAVDLAQTHGKYSAMSAKVREVYAEPNHYYTAAARLKELLP